MSTEAFSFLSYLRLLLSNGVEIRQACGEAPESNGKPSLAAADASTAAKAVPEVFVAFWQKNHLERSRRRLKVEKSGHVDVLCIYLKKVFSVVKTLK